MRQKPLDSPKVDRTEQNSPRNPSDSGMDIRFINTVKLKKINRPQKRDYSDATAGIGCSRHSQCCEVSAVDGQPPIVGQPYWWCLGRLVAPAAAQLAIAAARAGPTDAQVAPFEFRSISGSHWPPRLMTATHTHHRAKVSASSKYCTERWQRDPSHIRLVASQPVHYGPFRAPPQQGARAIAKGYRAMPRFLMSRLRTPGSRPQRALAGAVETAILE